jgi:hypothetical protein
MHPFQSSDHSERYETHYGSLLILIPYGVNYNYITFNCNLMELISTWYG